MEAQLPKQIAERRFVIIGTGETYQAEILQGDRLFPTMMEWMYGENWQEEASLVERQSYWEELCEIDGSWNEDADLGPVRWSTDVGETDHIEIYLLPDKAQPEVPAKRDGR